MKECTKSCVEYFINSLYTEPTGKIFLIIESFIKDVSLIHTENNNVLNRFYDYLYKKKFILCEIGMYYLEKYILVNTKIHYLTVEEKNTNNFINNKMIMFKWIEVTHLEIEDNDYTEIIKYFKNIENQFTPSMMIKTALQTIKMIYNINSNEIGQDQLLPILIYIIIKSQVKDIYLKIDFMKKYRRKKYLQCHDNCLHLNNNTNINNPNCECITLLDNTPEQELEFYLLTYQSALFFIETTEYNTLNISKEEFEGKIEFYINDLQEIKQNKKGYIEKTKNKIKKIFGSLTDLSTNKKI
ncbi:Vacuolar sorting protein 9 domain protein [Spraguea lophii 42_110]|uniref:Vacuolar sorting protein 9 domain protein n=1 Tax=Spraguea lophii (strain 42_110) TaxID=1358809 RepID=S7WEC8_SPRLO|nr:Vacuolar sorting protein 9 domain protein [Spraguea lophii 42_110]